MGSAGFNWIDLGVFQVKIGYRINDLTKLMLLVVSGVGLLIHIYSVGYMADDKGRSRYFCGLSPFMFSMLEIVLANNFIMMFIFWELVGVSSYLLIGHWSHRPAPPDAANKAFLANRIGDFGFMLGILLVWSASGTVSFEELISAGRTLGFGSRVHDSHRSADLLRSGSGKSAQFPLHVWLPYATGGPNSRLRVDPRRDDGCSRRLHAGTVFLLFQPAPSALTVVLWIGRITSAPAALMATYKDDIKRILAYSTLSELGLMMAAVGLGAPQAGMFHLFTHASFKALPFLGAGSVIHSLHHEQDIWQMGWSPGQNAGDILDLSHWHPGFDRMPTVCRIGAKTQSWHQPIRIFLHFSRSRQ